MHVGACFYLWSKELGRLFNNNIRQEMLLDTIIPGLV
jgi:hypothetical protein